MPRNITKIRVFLASPGDTADERKSASAIIDELNQINTSDNIELELIKWETHAYSGIGEDAQDVINNQINDDYDIFVGVMWKRFGSPTKRASSGTEEEFLRALETFRSKSKHIKILFYFSQTPIPPKEIDLEQLQKINSFKTQLATHGVLYWEYSDIKEFETLLRVHVSKSAKEIINELNLMPTGSMAASSDVEESEGNDEPGLLDLIEEATEQFFETETVLDRMTELMTDLGTKLTKRAEEMNAVNVKIMKPQDIKKMVDKASTDMQLYVRRMSTEMPIFKESMGNAFDSLTKAYAIYYADWRGGSEDEIEAFKKLEEMTESMNDFLSVLHDVKQKISSLPRATTNFNKAKKDTEKIIKSLMVEVVSALNQIDSIRKLREST